MPCAALNAAIDNAAMVGHRSTMFSTMPATGGSLLKQSSFVFSCCRGAFRASRAALFGAMPAAALGGVATVLIALLWMKLFPTLRDVERLE
jgi:hypothetical protein